MKNYKKRIYFILIGIILILVLIIVGRSFAKYVYKSADVRVFESEAFYFESDIEDNNNTFNINWNSNSNKVIKFTVDNYINNLLYTEKDIKYKISYKLLEGDADDLILSLKDNMANEISSDTELILSGGAINSNIYNFTIKKAKDLQVDNTYKIELVIKSSEPYVNEKRSIINIKIYNKLDYEEEIITYDDYIEYKLDLYNVIDEDITFKINNSKLMVDMSNSLVKSAVDIPDTNYSLITLDHAQMFNANSYNIMLIKKSLQEITEEDIIF